MEVDLFETHDRLKHFKSGWEVVSQGVQDCLDNVPDEIKTPFYIFGHTKQLGIDERFNLFFEGNFKNFEEVPSERIIWIPRITKPLATPNSYLFKAQKNSDVIMIEWILPKVELWEQFEPGKMTYNETIWTSIQNYIHHRSELEKPDREIGANEIKEFKRIIASIAYFKQKNKPWELIT